MLKQRGASPDCTFRSGEYKQSGKNYLILTNFCDFQAFEKVVKFNVRQKKIAQNLMPFHITKQ